MWPRWVGIHIGWGSFPVAGTKIHCFLNFRNTLHYDTSEVLDEHSRVWILLQIEFLNIFSLLNQQIMDLFVINFQITTPHQERHAFLLLVNETKYVCEAVRNDTT